MPMPRLLRDFLLFLLAMSILSFVKKYTLFRSASKAEDKREKIIADSGYVPDVPANRIPRASGKAEKVWASRFMRMRRATWPTRGEEKTTVNMMQRKTDGR